MMSTKKKYLIVLIIQMSLFQLNSQLTDNTIAFNYQLT